MVLVDKLKNMKIKAKIEKEVHIKTLHVEAGVRYWEDATVNGVEDEQGDLIPCRDGDYWKPIIDVDSGQIINWTKGVIADIHYKVCDDGQYTLKDADGNIIVIEEGYVPNCMCPKENGYGDYIIIHIDENGFIVDWKADFSDFDDID
jgi:hypothetical protein